MLVYIRDKSYSICTGACFKVKCSSLVMAICGLEQLICRKKRCSQSTSVKTEQRQVREQTCRLLKAQNNMESNTGQPLTRTRAQRVMLSCLLLTAQNTISSHKRTQWILWGGSSFQEADPDGPESAANVWSWVVNLTWKFNFPFDMIKPASPKLSKEENESLHLLQIVPRHYNECKVHIENWQRLK